MFQVSLCGFILGSIFFTATVEVVLNVYSQRMFAGYVMALSFFHFSEYFTTAITNPSNLSLDSYLLNHSVTYWVAASASWLEYFLEYNYAPFIKSAWYVSIIGVGLCLSGEVTRKLAMLTAQKNFNHIVQQKRVLNTS